MNESWKAVFYGMNRGTTYEQKYDDPVKHAEYLVRVFSSPLYLFINGRPVLSIYVIENVPPKYLQLLRSHVYRLSGWNMFVIKLAMDYLGLKPYESARHSDALMEVQCGSLSAAMNSSFSACPAKRRVYGCPQFYPNLFWTDEVGTMWDTCGAYPGRHVHAFTPKLHPHLERDVPVWRGAMSGWGNICVPCGDHPLHTIQHS